MKLKLWKNLEYGVEGEGVMGTYLDGLREISANKLTNSTPELQLWISVLIDAGKYRDHKFIHDQGPKICKLAKLDFSKVFQAFELIWEQEDYHAV